MTAWDDACYFEENANFLGKPQDHFITSGHFPKALAALKAGI